MEMNFPTNSMAKNDVLSCVSDFYSSLVCSCC